MEQLKGALNNLSVGVLDAATGVMNYVEGALNTTTPTVASSDVDIPSLSDTPLSAPNESLLPSSGDSGLEHKIISSGPVLKSTHDLATRGEKRRVNNPAALGSLDEVARNDDNAQGILNAQGVPNPPADFSLGDTPLSAPNEELYPPTEGDDQIEHKIISFGPILKSTHDMASWAEKRRVNAPDSIDALDDIAVNPDQRGQGGQRRGGRGNGRRWGGARRNRQAGARERVGHNPPEDVTLADTPLQEPNESLLPPSNEPIEHKVVSVGHEVLKSTHDMATWREKRKTNDAAAAEDLDDLVKNQQGQGQQQSLVGQSAQ